MRLLPWLVAAASALETLVVYDSNYHDDIESALPAQAFGDAELTYLDYSESEFKLLPETYDSVVLLPKAKAKNTAKTWSAESLMAYTNQGGNLLVIGAADGVYPEGVRSYLNEIGIYPSPKKYHVYDYFSDDKSALPHFTDANLVTPAIVSHVDVADYHGGAALLANNPLVVPLVRCSETSFCAQEDTPMSEDTTWTYGAQGFAAAALQALNNARTAWVGDISLVTEELVSWTFQQRNVLKLQFVNHINAAEPRDVNPQLYRVTNDAIYTVGISELKKGEWVPYESEDAVQMSFKMLDPYVRLNMSGLGPVASVEGSDDLDAYAYSVQFTIPDHHGMFTFELDHKVPGYSYLQDKRVVTVRHLANDEYQRSWEITNSWMYVGSSALVVAAWLLFVFNYIYVGLPNKAKKTQ
ncbi:hypothetical protein DIURU_000750 [Diutina rugosa]|uniref:Dolichyl-diphosphooligosaccharide--protein glycosyltransferase subunit WBP1 n=1 Tax=Diutina rugosa TaxID=5481 RepID=A0A642UWW9_DIURU|nr:uncharacterized protein DIURU_000750 [Diutina rugosa]KAA8907066.1 hypothetical protein DIURU_000750 [Diutina rugosa]